MESCLILKDNMGHSEGQERRHSSRIDRQLEVHYYIKAGSEPITVHSENISIGGIHVRNPFPIDRHYKFPVSVVLDPAQKLEFKAIGRVAWQRQREEDSLWDMGIEFIQIQEVDRDIIRKFIEAAV